MIIRTNSSKFSYMFFHTKMYKYRHLRYGCFALCWDFRFEELLILVFCRNRKTSIMIQNNFGRAVSNWGKRFVVAFTYNVRRTSMIVRLILVDFINKKIAIKSSQWMNVKSDVSGRLQLLWKRVSDLFCRNYWKHSWFRIFCREFLATDACDLWWSLTTV